MSGWRISRSNCLKGEETTPLEPHVTEFKYYAPGIGMVQDGPLERVRAGKRDGSTE